MTAHELLCEESDVRLDKFIKPYVVFLTDKLMLRHAFLPFLSEKNSR